MPETAKFPTETIDLPSKGHFYDKENPLSSGQIELKYMTAKEEDILTSQNLIKKGIVIDKLIESLVVNKSIDLDTLLIGDKNAIMVASRILGYGADYNFEIDCPSCGEHNKDECNLSELEETKIKFKDLEKGKNEFEFELPFAKKVLTFKLLTQKDQAEIEEELSALKKVFKSSGVTPEITTRLKKIIVAIDGEATTVNSFVDKEFLSRDSLAFRKHLSKITPDIDMTYNFECKLCGYTEGVGIPLGVSFLWPSAGK